MRGDPSAQGALLFELSEFERGQETFVIVEFVVTVEGILTTSACGARIALSPGSTRDTLHDALRAAGVECAVPHRGDLPDIVRGDPHLDWVELLRDLAYGPDDLARLGGWTLVGARTDGASATVRVSGPDRILDGRYAFDGTYPAAVALTVAIDDAAEHVAEA
ncbi:hypothetical protein [Sanguibacter massiliensis]|uniref:hypothetical protein n=1 Tax=Sanguibacter massiliensis TaxID=1973217 RepID=UPI000C85B6E0|nr:hypothetical protein [Sanguibacter massiliensis]